VYNLDNQVKNSGNNNWTDDSGDGIQEPLLDVSNTAIFNPALAPNGGGTPPAAPTSLAATAVSKSQINLAWTYNADDETGFYIERCKGSTCTNFARIATVGANVTTYSNTGLSKNTTYRYRVQTYNASGVSGYSNMAAATTFRR
jgi:hypothetical protein